MGIRDILVTIGISLFMAWLISKSLKGKFKKETREELEKKMFDTK